MGSSAALPAAERGAIPFDVAERALGGDRSRFLHSRRILLWNDRCRRAEYRTRVHPCGELRWSSGAWLEGEGTVAELGFPIKIPPVG